MDVTYNGQQIRIDVDDLASNRTYLVLVDGQPTGQPVPFDAELNALADARIALVASAAATNTVTTNYTTLRQQALTAYATNNTFLGLASPSNAQTLAQVRALTRQMNALARVVFDRLDSTDGT